MTTSTRWNLFEELGNVQHEMEQLFGSRWSPFVKRAGFPAIDLRHTADDVVLTAELPGFEPDAIDITVNRDSITLTGKRAAEEFPQGASYFRRERRRDEFSRTVELPYEVDPQSADASYTNGVLTLKLSRPEEHKPVKVNVKVG